MKNTGRNEYLLGANDSLHNVIDDYSPQSAGVKTYNIVGCGKPTIGKVYILNKEKSGSYEYGLQYIDGDDFFQGLITELKNNGYKDEGADANLFVFP